MELFTGAQYMMLDVANAFGLDKKNWSIRLEWFKENVTKLEELMPQAKEPAMYFAAVNAYRKAARGEPTSHMISLDATASGLQLLSTMTGCEKSASLCNVVDTGNREDAYTKVYEAMLDLSGGKARIDRDEVKKAVMTAFYSSKAVPKRVFGEGELLQLFYRTLHKVAPGAWTLNEAMLAMWNPSVALNEWVMPDGFEVKIKVMDQIETIVHFRGAPYTVIQKVNRPTKEGRSLCANTTHSVDGFTVRELTRRCMYDPKLVRELAHFVHNRTKQNETKNDKMVIRLWALYEKTGFLSARIIKYLTPENAGHVDGHKILSLVRSFPKKPFTVISVHD